jgi:ATP-dependent Clp protease ATP-binding subunit ClpB
VLIRKLGRETAIAEGLAQRIADGDVPESKKGRELIAGSDRFWPAPFRGELRRLKAIINEIDRSAGNTSCLSMNFHLNRRGATTEGSLDASNMLKPALARGRIRASARPLPKNISVTLEKDAALEGDSSR